MCVPWSYRRYLTQRLLASLLAAGGITTLSLRLWAAVEASTQGVLGPPTVFRVVDLFVTLRPPPSGLRIIPAFSVFHLRNGLMINSLDAFLA